MTTRLFLICALLVSVAPVSADDPAQANKLLVEAMQLIAEAGTKQTPAEQLPLLEASHAKLIEIVEKHPSTDLAVKLATGQSIGIIALPELTAQMENLRRQAETNQLAADRDACLKSLDVTDPRCVIWFGEIVRAHLRAGNTQAALEAAMTAAPGTVRDSALYDIARHHAQATNLREALAVVESMETEAARISARRDIDRDILAIANSRLQEGDIEAALAAARSIESTQARDAAIHDIAAAQARAGSVQEALTTAESIGDNELRRSVDRFIGGALLQVANKQLQAGNFLAALGTANQITDPAVRNQLLARVARLQLQAGDLQDAVTTANQMQNSAARNQVLELVATMQLQAGNSKNALQTAQRIQDPTAQDKVIVRIVQKQLQAGQLQEASASAEFMQTAAARDQVYQELARLYTHTQAKGIDSALTFANLIERDDARDTRLYPIAQEKLRAGDIPAALSIAKTMKTNLRDNVLEEVVKFQTQAGQLADALVLTKLIGNENTRHTRLYYIAQAQLQAGDLQGASSTAELMPAGSFRDEILKAVQQRTQ